METTKDLIKKVTENLNDFLAVKNERYGDSALNPIMVFTKHINRGDSGYNSILVRLDDKISRIRNSETLRENDVIDIMGYLVLLCCERGWTDYTKLLD